MTDRGGEHEQGLRERKRAAVYSTIEQAALDLALEHGYEHVTVDMICRASMVSSRTFFNYFRSKEGVILGEPPRLPSDEEIEAFAQSPGGNLLADFVALIAATLLEREPQPALFQARRLLLQRSPELLSRQVARMGEREDQFVRIILARFQAQGRHGAEPDLEDEARMVVALATGVLRYAMTKWIAGGFAGNSGELLDRAIHLAVRVTSTTTSRTAAGSDRKDPHV